MKYTIMHVNDRAIKNINKIKEHLFDFEYINDIKFCNGHIENASHLISQESIKQDSWKPYDGRTSPPLPGELGVWVSYINIFKYIIDNNIQSLLVIEDDALLSENFIDKFNKCLNDLPEDFDFFSLSYFLDQNELTEDSDIGSEYIHKSINQYSSAVGIVFSLNGAKKILKLLKRIGIQYTNDCFIFHYSQKGTLFGYSLIKTEEPLISHTTVGIQSVIDPNNDRNTDNNIQDIKDVVWK